MITANTLEVLCFITTASIGLLFLSRSNNSNIKLLLNCNSLNADTILLHQALRRIHSAGLLGLLFSITLVQWDYCSLRQEVLCASLHTSKVLLAPGYPCVTSLRGRGLDLHHICWECMWPPEFNGGKDLHLGTRVLQRSHCNSGRPKTWANKCGSPHKVYVVPLSSISHIVSSPEWQQTVEENEGIPYLEASENNAAVTLSHIKGFACTHQKRGHRNRADQGSPLHLYTYLGMAGHSHIPELRTKSTDEWDGI